VIFADRLGERLAADEFHRVERLVVLAASGEFVDRHDVRVLQLARDLRLLEELPPRLRVLRLLRLQFLEGHFAVQVLIAGDPDLAKPALAVQSREHVARARRAVRRQHRRDRLRHRLD